SRHRIRSAMRTIGVLAAFILLLYGLHLVGFGPPLPSLGGSGGSASPSPSVSVSPSSPAAKPAFSASDPFAGSSAEQYADGATGAAPPPARALAGYSAAQVSFAYGMTKRLLVAANLDPQTLLGGAPQAFASLLVPRQRSYFLRNLDRTGAGANGRTNS